MTQDYTRGTDDQHRLRAHTTERDQTQQPEHHPAANPLVMPSNHAASLLGDRRLSSRGNSEVHAGVVRQAQQSHGNRAVQRVIQRVPTETINMEEINVPAPRRRAPDMDFTNDPEALAGGSLGGTVGPAPVSASASGQGQQSGPLSSIMNGLGVGSSVLGVGTGLTQHAADLAHLGRALTGIPGGFGPVSNVLGRSSALAR